MHNLIMLVNRDRLVLVRGLPGELRISMQSNEGLADDRLDRNGANVIILPILHESSEDTNS